MDNAEIVVALNELVLVFREIAGALGWIATAIIISAFLRGMLNK